MDDYLKPRADRSMALLSCLGEVVEKLIADRISHFALTTKNTIPPLNLEVPGRSSHDVA
jgi:hypothetical protein